MKDNTYPDRKSEVEYYYARALPDVGMYHSAQTYYLKVVQTGPSSQYFSSALAKLVSIARLTGDDYDLKLAIVKNRIAINRDTNKNNSFWVRRLKRSLGLIDLPKELHEMHVWDWAWSFRDYVTKNVLTPNLPKT